MSAKAIEYIAKEMNKNQPINGYSAWNYKISFDELSQYVKGHFIDDLPIISVGSGNGKFEKHCSRVIEKDIICVDPKPNSYNTGVGLYVKPIYGTFEELIENSPEIVGNCNLLIIWATPSLTYDIDAIKALKPVKMVILYDASGSAGSGDFHDYIDDRCDGEYTYNKSEEIFYSYKMFSFLNDMNYYTVRKYTRT